MAFENVTMFEFHLHLPDDDTETPAGETASSVDEPAAGRAAGDRIRRALLGMFVMTLVSVGLSVGVTLAVRRFRGGSEE